MFIITANKKIRDTLQKKGIKHWEVASALGIDESTLCRKLRHELSAADREKILSAIRKLSEERKAENG